MISEGIHQDQLLIARKQRLVIMRTMEVDQTVSNLFQVPQGCLGSIDKLSVAARNRKNPLEQQLTFLTRVDPLLAERLIHLRPVFQFEERFHGTLVGSG